MNGIGSAHPLRAIGPGGEQADREPPRIWMRPCGEWIPMWRATSRRGSWMRRPWVVNG